MKRLTIILILLGCITLSSHARLRRPYDRNFNPRSDDYKPYTIVPADNSLTTVFDGVEMSAMDYAEIHITHGLDSIYNEAVYHIVGFGPSPRLKALDKSSTERQKLIIADNPFYTASFDKPLYYDGMTVKIFDNSKYVILYKYPNCLADDISFDFDLGEYSCDFDIYILLNTPFIFDNAFSNFKLSDNIKSINIYMAVSVWEVGHEAFTALKTIEKVDIRLMSLWYGYYGNFEVFDSAPRTMVYSDSFTQETYDTTVLETVSSETEINEMLTNPQPEHCTNNIYRFFKKTHSKVEDISVDEYPFEYTIQGRFIGFSNLAPKELVKVYTSTGAYVGSYAADNNGQLTIDFAQTGFYILRINDICKKVIIN